MGPKVNKDVFCDLVELCAAIINKKPWTRARKVCRVLEYGKPTKAADTVKHLCSKENYAHKWQLNEFVSETNFMDRPKDSRKDDYYINEEGMYEIVFWSQEPKTKGSRRHCCNRLLPQVRWKLTNKSTGKISTSHHMQWQSNSSPSTYKWKTLTQNFEA